MSRVTIIGAHGKVALLAIPMLVTAGHEVRGVVRNPDHAQELADLGAEPVVADVQSAGTDELAALLKGSDVVVWSAGAGGGSPERTYGIDRDAAIRSMDAAEQAAVERYVMVSYFGAGPDHGVSPDNSFFAYAEAKAAADEHLQASSLAWTILRPSTLTLDEPTGTIDADAAESGKVSRANVARVIAAVVDAPEQSARRIIQFNDGTTSVDEVVRGA